MPKGFTVCCLLFGDHTAYANRCLGSIINAVDPDLVKSLRIGLNAVSPATRAAVTYWAQRCPVEEMRVYDAGGHNAMKYPLMRRMFFTPQYPVATPYLMWFDDDSCLAPETYPSWWTDVFFQMQDADMIGDIWTKAILGDQSYGIEAQSWYGKVAVPRKAHRFRFATGGWWCIRTAIVHHFDYPFLDLRHNGGDTMLGELMRQQRLRLRAFRQGMHINADEQGCPSKANRRGITENPVWRDFDRDEEPDRSHHNFVCTVYDPRQTIPVSGPSGPSGAIRLPGLTP